MKARPRRVEREVARHLNELFSDAGMSPVERIPVLGRTGPDITINECGLVIDVKSRKEVPKLILPAQGQVLRMGNLISFRLSELMDVISAKELEMEWTGNSVIVQRYWDHMNEWTLTEREMPSVTCVILHKSGARMPIGNSSVIILEKERTKLCQLMTPPKKQP